MHTTAKSAATGGGGATRATSSGLTGSLAERKITFNCEDCGGSFIFIGWLQDPLFAARTIVSEQPIDGCTTLVGWLAWSWKHGPLMVVQPIIVCYTTLAGCTTRS